MNAELVNIYIDRLLTEVGEGVKSRILLETQLKYTEQINSQLQKEIDELRAEYEEYKNKNTPSSTSKKSTSA